jgi:hypothetical protein
VCTSASEICRIFQQNILNQEAARAICRIVDKFSTEFSVLDQKNRMKHVFLREAIILMRKLTSQNNRSCCFEYPHTVHTVSIHDLNVKAWYMRVCTYKIRVHVFVEGISKSVIFNHFCFHSYGIKNRKFMISNSTMPFALRENSAVMY